MVNVKQQVNFNVFSIAYTPIFQRCKGLSTGESHVFICDVLSKTDAYAHVC